MDGGGRVPWRSGAVLGQAGPLPPSSNRRRAPSRRWMGPPSLASSGSAGHRCEADVSGLEVGGSTMGRPSLIRARKKASVSPDVLGAETWPVQASTGRGGRCGRWAEQDRR